MGIGRREGRYPRRLVIAHHLEDGTEFGLYL